MLIKNITTLEQLVSKLDNVTDPLDYFNVLNSMNIPFEEFERYFTWDDENPTRNCIASTREYELLLGCWELGQKSKIQDFNKAQAWTHIIQGTLKEERYLLSKNGNGLIKISSVDLKPGDFSYALNTGIHQFTNSYEARTVSLILYNKPIQERKIYECTDGICSTWVEEMKYDNVCVIDR